MLFAATAAVLALASAASAQTTFGFLSDDRNNGRITFVPLTPAEKKGLLTNAETLLTAWVNYDSKIANYGKEGDPFPTVRNLRANIDWVTDEDLQIGLSEAFLRIRDLHTVFYKTGPYSCFSATTGLVFEFAEGSADIVNSPKVVVSGYSSTAAVRNLLAPQLAKIKVGDELATINGESFVTWFRKNQFRLGAGANDFGGMRRGLDVLNTRSGWSRLLPDEDSITLQFRDRAHYGKLYEVEIPYVSARNDACWAASSQLYYQRTGVVIPGTPQSQSLVVPKAPKSRNDPRKQPLAFVLNDGSEPISAVRPVTLKSTDASSVSWGIWDPKGKNMGVIYLTDFSPKDPSGASNDQLAIEVVRSLLANELKDTNSVLVDIRDNGGGSINYANGLPQLFKPDFNQFGARYLRNNVTYNLFARTNQLGQQWQDAWKESKPTDRYTPIKYFGTFAEANALGQAYLKPMGVFNNGRCYSACDMFSANVQDSATGTIFGEDGQTGAGGANVLEFSDYLTYDPIDFTPLPLQQIGARANNMRAGVRQSVRNGRNNGKLIEDLGIKADFIFRPRVTDLLPNATSSSQFDRIADKLKEIGDKTGQNSLYFVAEPLTREVQPGALTLSAQAAGIQEFTIQDTTGKTLGTVKPSSLAKSTVSLKASAPRTTLGNSQLVIIGKTGGKQVLKTKRNLRVVPVDADRIDITKGAITFNGFNKAIGLYNGPTTPDANGFNKVKDTWIIGDGKLYADNTDSAIEVFLKAPVGTAISISLDASYDTEKDFDYLTLFVRNADGSVKHFLTTGSVNGVSGKGTVSKTFAFTTTSSTFSAIVRFTSDGGVEGSGVTINSFKISPAAA
ncbi:hypothetical protein HK105_205995 [Polyrhizophydium stewartii]|uniref:Tail specific protease domain-containing protein n=1 Tax=Polyrhizophydium stewartii TaxID=2732419 RepID=A0ABR4N4K4_9FUNG|nr:hypothetical protein HK105_003460 [Polyrhizophydium stewartii]